MNTTMSEINRLKIERHKIDVEINRLTEKIKSLQEEKKDIDNRIVIITNSEKRDSVSFSSVL